MRLIQNNVYLLVNLLKKARIDEANDPYFQQGEVKTTHMISPEPRDMRPLAVQGN